MLNKILYLKLWLKFVKIVAKAATKPLLEKRLCQN